jgi:GTP-dependent phosphoenolpyruvate carboxykinase
MATLLEVDLEGWKQRLPQMHEHYAAFGEKLPAELHAQLETARASSSRQLDLNQA